MDFIVVPDHPAAAGIGSGRQRVLRHHSGRPWLVGTWRDEDAVHLTAGRNQAVFFGTPGDADSRLAHLLAAARTVSDLDALARALPGCFHFVASLNGHVRLQGSLAGVCQVFFGQVGGVTVAADRPQALAALAGTGVDAEAVALRLLSPYGPPWPLGDQSVWSGVDTLAPGHYLALVPEGSARPVRWWSPPEPELSHERAAPLLRTALADAVAARVARVGAISADLSGGVDSTSLCYLADRGGARLVTVRYAPLGGPNEDSGWAARCAGDLPGQRHLVVPADTAEEWCGDAPHLAAADDEGPYPFDRSRPTTAHTARIASTTSSTRHLLGIGADELFQPPNRQPSDTTSYAEWLAVSADRLRVPWGWRDRISWEVEPKLPPWATREAADAVRRRLRAAADDTAPLADDPGRHQALRLTLMNGAIVRRVSRAGQRSGVSFHAPYLDDRVLEVVLAARPPRPGATGPAKPLLAAAMRGTAPDGLTDRRAKEPSTHEGLAARRRWHALDEVVEDSRLARLGLVDPAELRAALLRPPDRSRPPVPRDPTLACELWLRALPAHS